jgi:hypothetical protein
MRWTGAGCNDDIQCEKQASQILKPAPRTAAQTNMAISGSHAGVIAEERSILAQAHIQKSQQRSWLRARSSVPRESRRATVRTEQAVKVTEAAAAPSPTAL